MTAHELLLQLRAKGVEVNASGDGRLIIDAPKGTITEDLRSSLSTHKAELLEILKQQNALDAPPSREVVAEMLPVAAEKSLVVARPVEAPAPSVLNEDQAVAASVAEEVTQLESELMRLDRGRGAAGGIERKDWRPSTRYEWSRRNGANRKKRSPGAGLSRSDSGSMLRPVSVPMKKNGARLPMRKSNVRNNSWRR
jgi:hypothetical protein